MEIRPPSDMVAHTLKWVLPPLYDSIEHAFLWKFLQGMLPFVVEALICHQDSCYVLNKLVHHVLNLHVYKG